MNRKYKEKDIKKRCLIGKSAPTKSKVDFNKAKSLYEKIIHTREYYIEVSTVKEFYDEQTLKSTMQRKEKDGLGNFVYGRNFVYSKEEHEYVKKNIYMRKYLKLKVYCGSDYIPLADIEDGLYKLTIVDMEDIFGNNNCVRLLKDRVWKEAINECTTKEEPYKDIEQTAWNESRLFSKCDIKRNRSKRNADLKKARSLEEDDVDRVDSSKWGYTDRDWRW